MIIDLLSQCTTIVKCDYYDAVGSSLLVDNYSIKNNDIYTWRLINPAIESVEFRFISPTTKLLKNMIFDIKGGELNGDITYKLETSIDYINWYELKYKTDLDNIKTFIKTSYGWKDLDTLEDVSDFSNKYYKFEKLNEFSNTYEYLYPNLEFKYVKLTIYNINGGSLLASIDNPIFFNKAIINIEEEYQSLDTNLLEIKSDMFYKQKIFEEFEFFPNLVKIYLMMLEEKIDKITHYNLSAINVNKYDVNVELLNFMIENGVNIDEIELNLFVY